MSDTPSAPSLAAGTPAPEELRIGEWCVRPRLNRIERGEERRQLEPRLIELLCFFALNPRRVVSREEIVAAVWDGAYLSDSALTRSISELRRALGDDAQAPTYLETIPKRGYRLVAAVETGSRDRSAAGPERERSPLLLLTVAVAFGGVLLLAGLLTIARPSSEEAASARSPELPTDSALLRQLTTWPGLEVFPAYSPDGTRLAYASDRTRRLEIWVRQLAPGSEDLQLTDDGGQNVQPTWSPDGRFLAYHSVERGGIWLVPALGGETRRLTDFGSRPSWSPDGRWLVFQSLASAEVSLTAYAAMPPSTLWRVAVDGGEPEPLTEPGWPPGGHGGASWSPAGDLVVFLASDFGSTTVWTVRPDDGQTRQIDVEGRPREVVWQPDGRGLWYAGTDLGDHWLWRQPLEGEATKVVRAPLRHLSVRPDGDALVASRLDQQSKLGSIAIDPSTGEPRSSPALLTLGTHERDTRPDFSPDGERVVFPRSPAGQLAQLYLIDADGGEPVQLTLDENLFVHSPVWHQDGGEVLFLASSPEALALRAIEVDTRQVRELARLPGDGEKVAGRGADWRALRISPDGRRLAFYRTPRGEHANVWVAALDRLEQPVQVTHEAGFVGFPVWSRDGRHLAVELARPFGYQLGVVDLESGELRQLTDRPGEHWPGGFSPDGKRIVYAYSADGIWGLAWIDRETGESRDLVPERELAVYYRYPAWSPDGDQIVFERGEITTDLWEVVVR